MRLFLLLLLILGKPCSGTAQWSLIHEVPGMARVAALDSIVLVGTSAGGAWLSIDHGESWSDISSGLPSGSIRSMAIGANDMLFCTIGSAVYRRSGAGGWQQVYQPGGSTFQCILARGDTIAAGADFSGRVHISTDNGTSWSISTNSPTYITDLAWWGGQLIASSFGSGVQATLDLGLTWLPFAPGSNTQVYSLASTATRMLSGTFTGVQASNGTNSWSTVFTPSIEMNRMEADQNFVLGSFKYFSSDNGITWQERLPPSETAFEDVDLSGGFGYVICANQRLYRFDIAIWLSTQENVNDGQVDLRYDASSNSFIIASITEPATLLIYDSMGRVLASFRIGHGLSTIQAGILPEGVYLARTANRTIRFQISR